MVRFGTASRSQSRVCRIAVRLTLLFFVLRAAFPAGYMPAPGVLEHGQVRIVICTGSGTQALLVDEAGQPVDGADGGSASERVAGACAFGMASALAFALPVQVATPLPAGVLSDDPTPVRVRASLSAAPGAPLGPRAPPVLLG